MLEMFKNIVKNVLEALYQPFGFALILTIFFTCVYMFAKEFGWKTVVCRWWQMFKNNIEFRRVFFLVFYTVMILFRTLLNRKLWENALVDVIGVWGLYNSNGELTTEVIENLVLFIPFTVLLLWNFHDAIIGTIFKLHIAIWRAVLVVFLFSATIEFMQLFFRLGTFQLSDLFYNTLGGLIGGFIYWCGYKVAHRNKKEKEDNIS